MKNFIEHKKLLIIGFVWPEPNSSAAGGRMMQLIHYFLELNYEITFATTANPSDFQVDLTIHKIRSKQIKLNNASFDELLLEINPKVVLFDRYLTEEQFGWRVAKHCPDTLKILDTEDLHFLRQARWDALKQNRDVKPEDLISDQAKREIASIYRCDCTLIISEYEKQLLENFYLVPKQQLNYLPLLCSKITENQTQEWLSFSEKQHFCFIGNFLHAPNWDAVLHLKNVIWPKIHSVLPKVELHIYGAYPPPKAMQLHNPKQGFYVLGRAESAQKVFEKARVCLAPLRFGAGIKGKLIECMLYGTPSVTTEIGAEGMRGELDWNGEICLNDDEFAKQAIELYSNEKKWTNARENGIEIINQRFEESLFKVDFIEHINNLLKNLSEHRLKNFTGAMLHHHTLKSTEYMSRWIEEKNKKSE